MKLTKDNIEITHFLSGFHSFRKDHNYTQYKGNFINDISDLLGSLTLDQIDQGPQSILKCPQKSDFFEIRLGANLFTYQDNLVFNDFQEMSLKLFNLWQNYSSQIKLRLVGLVIYFSINTETYKEKGLDYFLSNSFSKFKSIKELTSINLALNFTTEIDSEIFNGQIHLVQNVNSIFPLIGSVDINFSAINFDNQIPVDKIVSIFTKSKSFFDNQFLNILNESL